MTSHAVNNWVSSPCKNHGICEYNAVSIQAFITDMYRLTTSNSKGTSRTGSGGYAGH